MDIFYKIFMLRNMIIYNSKVHISEIKNEPMEGYRRKIQVTTIIMVLLMMLFEIRLNIEGEN
jgi:predicted membrane protein